MRLHSYANAVQPIERIFDGLFLALDFGRGALLDTRAVDNETLQTMTVPMQIRDDLGVPALVFNGETEAPWPFRYANPKPTRSGCGRS
jgi:alpha/beta hydrolase family protein